METGIAPDAFARDCASRPVLDRIGDTWSVLVTREVFDEARAPGGQADG